VYGLAKLQNPEELSDGSLDIKRVDNGDDSDDEEKEPTPTRVLLDIMQYDPAAYVLFPRPVCPSYSATVLTILCYKMGK
jgi:hypothetical protein